MYIELIPQMKKTNALTINRGTGKNNKLSLQKIENEHIKYEIFLHHTMKENMLTTILNVRLSLKQVNILLINKVMLL